MNRTLSRLTILATLLLSAIISVGAFVWADGREESLEPAVAVAGGDPIIGRDLLRDFGCMACHSIPGVRGPDVHVGPPLDVWSERRFIAGRIENTPENLVTWIQVPQSVDPETSMPTLGVGEEDARHMAAYLYTLD